jgi:hypothetical protein
VKVLAGSFACQSFAFRSELPSKKSVWIDLRDRIFDRETPLHDRGRDVHRHGAEIPRRDEP